MSVKSPPHKLRLNCRSSTTAASTRACRPRSFRAAALSRRPRRPRSRAPPSRPRARAAGVFCPCSSARTGTPAWARAGSSASRAHPRVPPSQLARRRPHTRVPVRRWDAGVGVAASDTPPPGTPPWTIPMRATLCKCHRHSTTDIATALSYHPAHPSQASASCPHPRGVRGEGATSRRAAT